VEVHGISVDGFAGLSEIPTLVLFLLIFLGRKREVPKGSDPRVVDKSTRHTASPMPYLDPKFFPKFYYVKRKFLITSKYRQMHGVLNVDKIKN
jgi:hypothetical protein